MSQPLIKRVHHIPNRSIEDSLENCLKDLAQEAACTVSADAHEQMRYGKVHNGPAGFSVQEITLGEQRWYAIAVVMLHPASALDDAGNFVKTVVDGSIAEHLKHEERCRLERSADDSEH